MTCDWHCGHACRGGGCVPRHLTDACNLLGLGTPAYVAQISQGRMCLQACYGRSIISIINSVV